MTVVISHVWTWIFFAFLFLPCVVVGICVRLYLEIFWCDVDATLHPNLLSRYPFIIFLPYTGPTFYIIQCSCKTMLMFVFCNDQKMWKLGKQWKPVQERNSLFVHVQSAGISMALFFIKLYTENAEFIFYWRGNTVKGGFRWGVLWQILTLIMTSKNYCMPPSTKSGEWVFRCECFLEFRCRLVGGQIQKNIELLGFNYAQEP